MRSAPLAEFFSSPKKKTGKGRPCTRIRIRTLAFPPQFHYFFFFSCRGEKVVLFKSRDLRLRTYGLTSEWWSFANSQSFSFSHGLVLSSFFFPSGHGCMHNKPRRLLPPPNRPHSHSPLFYCAQIAPFSLSPLDIIEIRAFVQGRRNRSVEAT